MKKTILYTTAAAISLLAVSAVQAGEYDSGILSKTPGSELTPVEYGSGWYLRGDLTFNLDARQELNTQFVPALGATLESDYNDVLGFKAGFGFQFNPSFRADVTAEISLDSDFQGANNVLLSGTQTIVDPVLGTVIVNVNDIPGIETISASYNSTNFMFNGYFDLPTMGRFTPYIGAGIGLARVEYNERRAVSCVPDASQACGLPAAGAQGVRVDDVTVLDIEEVNFTHAYQISIGTAYAISDTLSLDIGYTYFETGDGPEINYADGTAIDVDGYSVHKVNAGLRYELW